MVIFESIIGLVSFILYFATKSDFLDNCIFLIILASDLFGCDEYSNGKCVEPSFPGYAIEIIIGIYILIMISVSYSIVSLLYFHIKLIRQGISTYYLE